MNLRNLLTCLLLAICFVCLARARAQMPEERPMTAQEAREELASFKNTYKDEYVHLIPTAQVTLDIGAVVTVTSAKVVRDRLLVNGTIRNASPRVMPAGAYTLSLIESFEFQVAKFQKQPVKIGSCGGPCVNSYNDMFAKVRRLAPGQSATFSATSRDFSRTFPKAKASDMIVVVGFSRK